jgi:hypothetical protein
MPEINWLAVVVAAIACFLLGGLWYSPVLFGKAWQRETGLTDEKLRNGNMVKLFAINGGYHTLQFTIIGLVLALMPCTDCAQLPCPQ